LFDPGIYDPAIADFLGRADFAGRERVAKIEKRLTCLRILLHLAERGEAFNGGFQGRHARAV